MGAKWEGVVLLNQWAVFPPLVPQNMKYGKLLVSLLLKFSSSSCIGDVTPIPSVAFHMQIGLIDLLDLC